MRVLFLHNNFPAQFRHVAHALAQSGSNQVVFATQNRTGSIPGVTKVHYAAKRETGPAVHPYIRGFESAVLNGQAVYRLALGLKQRGFSPDLVVGHSGWGPTLYIRDVFPDAKLINYFEWYYRAHGSDADFLPDAALSADDECRIRTRNAPILLDVTNCDLGVTPTRWQRRQFPELLRPKLRVLHDGIDTDFFRPEPGAKLKLDGLDLSAVPEIVTYATRGMEPYRGFPQFMRAMALVQHRRPRCHVVVVGEDRVAYGRKLPAGESYKKRLLAEVDLDPDRIHFTGLLPYAAYRRVLQASAAHVYGTVPFVLSWSLIEAMAAGCAIVASDTAPVREVLEDGRNAKLYDFFSPEALADRVVGILESPAAARPMRRAARETVLRDYALTDLLPRQLRLYDDVVAGRVSPRDPAAAPRRRADA